MNSNSALPIVALETFIQSTRDSGYKNTGNAIAELVDNSIEAGAQNISITIDKKSDRQWPLSISLIDDGQGMTAKQLHTALQFGGSSRFNERGGMGRFGMGLPNSSFSQARRVDVFTRVGGLEAGAVYHSYLSLDEIARGQVSSVPIPKLLKDSTVDPAMKTSGTQIVWSECDRLDYKQIARLSRLLRGLLGRKFRYKLWEGVSIEVNGVAVAGFDPLYLNPTSRYAEAVQYGDVMHFDVATDAGGEAVGKIDITFVLLPVRWSSELTVEEKRRRGVAKGAGVSIIRAGREIDYGWFFLSGKRKENYDDWWRCEIKFDPILDEEFGITHTKQQIKPSLQLKQLLSDQMASVAKKLNQEVQNKMQELKAAQEALLPEQEGSQNEIDAEQTNEVVSFDTIFTNQIKSKAFLIKAANTAEKAFTSEEQAVIHKFKRLWNEALQHKG